MGQVQYHAGHPLFHALGASRLDRTICVSHRLRGLAGHAGRGHRQRLRADGGRRPGRAVGHQRRLLHDQRHDARQAGARPRGAYVVVIDPYRTPTAQQADEHLMVRPGTDGALALARDARADRARAASTRSTSRAPPSASTGWPSTSSTCDARAGGRRSSGCPPRRSWPSRAATARRARVHPDRHRALPPRQRRHDVPDPRLPARAHRRLRRSRTAARCSRPAARSAFDLARPRAPGPAAAAGAAR